MKKYFIVVAIGVGFFISKSADAQGPLQVGINAAPLVRQFFNLSDEPAAVNPYMLIAEYKLSKFGLRAGVGVNNSFDKQLPDTNEGTPEIITKTNAYNVRAGIVGYRPMGQKWQLKYGVDAHYGESRLDITTLSTDFFGKEQSAKALALTREYGLSPFLFLQWNLNDRISLGTEVLGNVSYQNVLTQEENSQFPDFNDTDERNVVKYNILAPTSVFLIYNW